MTNNKKEEISSNKKIDKSNKVKKEVLVKKDTTVKKETVVKKDIENTKSWKSINFLQIIFIVVIVAILINTLFLFNLTQKLDSKLTAVIEENKWQLWNLYVLEDINCNECQNIDDIKEQITKANIELAIDEKIDINSQKGKDLIKQYWITKIPAIIFEWQTNLKKDLIKSWEKSWKNIENSFVWESTKFPYYDVASAQKIWLVDLVVVTKSNCENCINPDLYINQFKSSNVYINNQNIVDSESDEWIAIIEKYAVKILPFIKFSKELAWYKNITENWANLWDVTQENEYIISKLNPPYFDIENNKIIWLTELTYLVDESCTDCYDVNIHKDIFSKMWISISKESTIDISSAKWREMVKKYSIKKVPTVILSPEAKYYPQFNNIWEQVWSVEDDWNYIFRKLEAIWKIKYKDI